ncbi:hypothetical protein HDV00_001585 [Rhizophlyctis rosea]|nr:hypothetical protein HDV00_001585 [Rhizophlyctis rosea]
MPPTKKQKKPREYKENISGAKPQQPPKADTDDESDTPKEVKDVEERLNVSDLSWSHRPYRPLAQNMNYGEGDPFAEPLPKPCWSRVPTLAQLCARVVAFYIDAVPTFDGIPWESGGKLIKDEMGNLRVNISPYAMTILSSEYPEFTQQNQTLTLRGRLHANVFSRLFSPKHTFSLHLTHLNLRKTNITDAEAVAIARLNCLVFLDLSETAHITDVTVQTLGRTVMYGENATTLQHLRYANFRQTYLTDVSLPYFPRFPTLIAFDVSSTFVSPTGLKSMLASHPWTPLPPEIKLFDTSPASQPIWNTKQEKETHDCPAFRALPPSVQDIVLGATLPPEVNKRNEVWHCVMGKPMDDPGGPVPEGDYFMPVQVPDLMYRARSGMWKLVRKPGAPPPTVQSQRKQTTTSALLPMKRRVDDADVLLTSLIGTEASPTPSPSPLQTQKRDTPKPSPRGIPSGLLKLAKAAQNRKK